jgi:sarcosine oxidase
LSVDRRTFLKAAAAQAAFAPAAAAGLAAPAAAGPPARTGRETSHIAVIGAGVFGGWTALHLQRLGHTVTLIDAYGPGNSRASSGDETRGLRSSYGDRPHGRLWVEWANRAFSRWKEWDAEWGPRAGGPLVAWTGDVIFRADWDNYTTTTREHWDALDVPYEVLDADELRRRYPQFGIDDIGLGLFEPGAGVVRARQACLTVATAVQEAGGRLVIGRASFGRQAGGRLLDVRLEPGGALGADAFVFALGPWYPKAFPELMGNRLRIPRGNVFYLGVPPGDPRFAHPNCPSFSLGGTTGWPTLPHDSRGFRVRMGGAAPDDPDTNDRTVPESLHERLREYLAKHVPALAKAPILETRSCHYESSIDRNWFIDTFPGLSNAWLVGGGSAEAFKFGPVLGEYIADRVAGRNDDRELVQLFRLKEEEFEPPPAD